MSSARPMREADLQRTVEELAARLGFLVFHDRDSRRNNAGFLDTWLIHPASGHLLVRELKTESGRLTSEQEDWFSALTLGGYDVAVWRPSDLHTGRIQQELEAARGPRFTPMQRRT